MLARAGVTSNKNPVPFDARNPAKWTGLRLGVAAVTTRGFRAVEMVLLGKCIAHLLRAAANGQTDEAVTDATATVARLAHGPT